MDSLGIDIFGQLGNILGVVFVALASMAVAWIRKRMKLENLELSASQEAWLRDQARKVAMLVEEKFSESPGSQKAEAALATLRDRVRAEKSVPDFSDSRIREELDSVLPEVGVGKAARKAMETLGKFSRR